jgi:plastocyanin
MTALGLAALPAVASARTQVVYGGGSPAFAQQLIQKGGEALAYFPSTVKIHAGDSIAWLGLGPGFHDVDIVAKGGALPLILPTANTTGLVADAAGNPFWFATKVPILGFNPVLLGPSGGHKFKGTGRVDSGLPLGPPKPFVVKFTKAGRFNYFCDVHPGMKGKVVVLPKGKAIPSRAQVAAQVATQQATDAAEAKTLLKTKITGDVVSMGVHGTGGVEILGFFLGVKHIKAGTTITFEMGAGSFETHTATFGPDSYLSPLAASFASPVIDSRGAYPSSPPGTPISLDPAAHGNGFANTGAMQGVKGSPLPALNKITFTQKGTYKFECLIHEFMKGVVVVS